MKRSGFAVKVKAFYIANAADHAGMGKAIAAIEKIGKMLEQDGFADVHVDGRFMLSREVPDEPKAAQAVTAAEAVGAAAPTVVTVGLRDDGTIGPMPPIPPQFDRRGKA